MDASKVLAQSYPTAETLTDVYTVPANKSAVVSTLKVCNQSDEETTFRAAVAVAGAADESKQYVYYDVPIAPNDTFSSTEGWTLGAADVLRVRSGNGRCSYNVFGIEVT